MKNRNLVETRTLKNNVLIFICSRQCTPSRQQNEINHFYLWAILPDLKWKKKSRHICRTNDITGALLHVIMTVDCLQTSFVEKLWRRVWQAHISLHLDDQGVICPLHYSRATVNRCLTLRRCGTHSQNWLLRYMCFHSVLLHWWRQN